MPLSEARLAAKRACTARWRAANKEHEQAYRKKYQTEHRDVLQPKKRKHDKTHAEFMEVRELHSHRETA